MATRESIISYKKFKVWSLRFFIIVLAIVFSAADTVTTPYAGAVSHMNGVYFNNPSGISWSGAGTQLIVGRFESIGNGEKQKFIDTVMAHYNQTAGYDGASSSRRSKAKQSVSAAYIVHTMLGHGRYQGRSLSSSTINDWKERVLSDNITMTKQTFSSNVNTKATPRSVSTGEYWTSENKNWWNVWQYSENTNRSSLVFRDTSNGNRVVYVVKMDCANPLGSGLPGLPSANYNLTPDITGTPSVTEQPTDVTISPAVGNSGSTIAPGIRWQITDFSVAPGATLPVAGTGGVSPESYYGNSFIAKEEGTTNFRVGIHNFNQRTRSIGQHPVGTRLCYGLSVRPHTHASGNVWRHSAPFCVVIAKTPKAQVRGGDLISIGGDIRGSVSGSDISGVNRLFGSWGEYGVFAGGAVTGVASAAGYARGSVSNSFCDVSLLTFTNATNNSCTDSHEKGNYTGITNNVSSIKARFSGGAAITSGTVNLSSTAKGQYESTRSTLTITNGSAEIPKGKYVVINAPNAVVTINNNIRYTGERLVSAGEIPQVVIVAREINIRGSVTQLDAWLVADTVNTCSDVGVTSRLSTAICNQQLVVNGPVIADTIHLRRTHGAENNSPGVAAEVFNLRPDAYLWATHLTTSSGRLQSTASKELPPRF